MAPVVTEEALARLVRLLLLGLLERLLVRERLEGQRQRLFERAHEDDGELGLDLLGQIVQVLLVGGRQQHARHPGTVRGDDLVVMVVKVVMVVMVVMVL